MNDRDHAIVIGIQRYPTLGGVNKAMNLEAPDNDAKAVADWLKSSKGGHLAKKNVHLIRSADYPDPFSTKQGPKPILNDIVEAFKAVIRSRGPDRRVGRRFYLYVSGHGFGHERHRGALLTANADELDRDHFYVPSYFDWLVEAALFDQYVLWFDACSTRERLKMPKLASFSTAASQRASEGREMVVYAARFFWKAVENTINGKPHGVFTHTLLEGLKGGAVDPGTGAVTTASLRNYLINNMRRHMSLTQLQDPEVSKEPDFGTVDDFELVPPRGAAARAPAPAGPDVRLLVRSGDPATEIFVVDLHDRLVGRGLKEVELRLPTESYIVRARLGRDEWQETVTLEADRTIDVPLILSASAVPLDEPSWDHEAHVQSRTHETHGHAARIAATAAIGKGPGQGASLMVMARWWTGADHGAARLPKPQAGLELRHHGRSDRFDLAKVAVEGDLDRDRWATSTVSVDPGLHGLVLRVDGKPAEMTLTALDGYQTRVFLLFAPASAAGSPRRGKRLTDVSIQMWKGGLPEDDAAIRLADAARMALGDERSIMSAELLNMAGAKFQNPMMGLYALHLMLLIKRKERKDQITERRRPADTGLVQGPDRPARFDRALFDMTLANTMNFFGEDHPDIRAIRFAATQTAGLLPIATPPMLWHSWAALIEASNTNPRLLPVDLWERVADQFLSRPFLIWTRRSAAEIRAQRETLQLQTMLARARVAEPFDAEVRAASALAPFALPFGGSPTLPPDAIARAHARSDPDPELSPLTEEEQKRRLSSELGVPRSVIDQALAAS